MFDRNDFSWKKQKMERLMHAGTQISTLLPLFTQNEFSIGQVKMHNRYYLLVVLPQYEPLHFNHERCNLRL